MQVMLDWESSALAAPQSFRDQIEAAANILNATIVDNITVTIKIGYGDYNNGADTGLTTGAEANALWGVNVSYATLRGALASHETSGLDMTLVNSLPNASSIDGISSFFVPEAEAKALGLWTFGSGYEDGAAGFGTQIPTNLLVGVALHELTHALGRVGGDGPFDLMRYTSAGQILHTGGDTAVPAYFSIDGGNTKIADFGQTSDPGDFLNSGVQGPNDPFNEFYSSSTIQSLTTIDTELLDAMGFRVTPELPYNSSALVADLNGDHKADVLQLNGQSAYVHLSTGTSFAASTYWGSGLTSSDKAVDVNGDGRADMVQYYGGTEYVALSNGSSFGSWTQWASGATSSDTLIDVNGDGMADLVQYYNSSEYVALSNGSSFGPWTHWASGATSSDKLVDLNGDHKADLLQFYNGIVAVALSTGSGFGTWTHWASGGTVSDQTVDVNGDGKADLVQFYNGIAVVALSNGTSFGSWTHWATGVTPSDRLVDVNGDGKADLVQYYNGSEYVALSNGSSFGPWTHWAAGATSADQLVDLNGDGKADLLQFYNGNAYAALSNGSSFGPWQLWGAPSSTNGSATVANGGTPGTVTSTPVTNGTDLLHDTFTFASGAGGGNLNTVMPVVFGTKNAAPDVAHFAIDNVLPVTLGHGTGVHDKMDAHLLHTTDFVFT